MNTTKLTSPRNHLYDYSATEAPFAATTTAANAEYSIALDTARDNLRRIDLVI